MSQVYYPPGKYECKVEKQGFGKASTGSLVFVLYVEVLAKLNGESKELVPERLRRTVECYITDKTAKRFRDSLALYGYHGTDLQNLNPESDRFTFDFRGESHVFECRHEEYRGKPQEKWGLQSTRVITKAASQDIEIMNRLFNPAAPAAEQSGADEDFNF